MFGMDVSTLRKVWTVFLFALVVLLLYLTGRTLVVFTLAVFLAHLLGPIAETLERVLSRRWVSRNLSLAIVFLLLVVVIATVLVPVASQVGQQAAALASHLPDAFKAGPLASSGATGVDGADARQSQQYAAGQLVEFGRDGDPLKKTPVQMLLACWAVYWL